MMRRAQVNSYTYVYFYKEMIDIARVHDGLTETVVTISLEDADKLADIIQDNIIPSFKVKED